MLLSFEESAERQRLSPQLLAPGAAGDGQRPPARGQPAADELGLICDLAGFGFVNLFEPLLNQSSGGFACTSYYQAALWGSAGGNLKTPAPALEAVISQRTCAQG